MALDAVFGDQWGRVLATLAGILGDIELAEDAAAEAFAIAAERWPRDGEPANPAGWLITTARNRAIDHLRRQQTLAGKTKLLARGLETAPQPPEALMDDAATIPDERLELTTERDPPDRPRRSPRSARPSTLPMLAAHATRSADPASLEPGLPGRAATLGDRPLRPGTRSTAWTPLTMARIRRMPGPAARRPVVGFAIRACRHAP